MKLLYFYYLTAISLILATPPPDALAQRKTVEIVVDNCNATPKSCTRRVGYIDPTIPNPPHPTGVKFASPSCPSGYDIIGGGYRIVSWGSANANKVQIWWSFPETSLNRWAVHVRNTDPNTPTPAPLIKVEVSATCVVGSTHGHQHYVLTEIDVPIPPNPYKKHIAVQARFKLGRNDINEVNAFLDYAKHLCVLRGFANRLPRVFYSPQIGLHSFSIDEANRRYLSQKGTDNVLTNHPTVKEVQITHIRCWR